MPIAESDVRWVKAPRMGLADRLYLPAIAQGLESVDLEYTVPPTAPDRTSPALIGLPGLPAGWDCCAHAEGATGAAAMMMTAKRERLPNRRFVMSISSVCVG